MIISYFSISFLSFPEIMPTEAKYLPLPHHIIFIYWIAINFWFNSLSCLSRIQRKTWIYYLSKFDWASSAKLEWGVRLIGKVFQRGLKLVFFPYWGFEDVVKRFCFRIQKSITLPSFDEYSIEVFSRKIICGTILQSK